MAEGWNPTVANNIIACYFKGTSITAPTNTYLKLHLGAPGAAGTANAALETSRKVIAVGTPSGGGVASNTDMAWASVSTTEHYFNCSVWDTVGPTGGNFIASGSLTAAAVNATDAFTISSGNFTVQLAVAS